MNLNVNFFFLKKKLIVLLLNWSWHFDPLSTIFFLEARSRIDFHLLYIES